MELPDVGLGTWKNTGEQCTESVATALELGYRHVDTADAYGNERAVGAGLRRADVERSEVVVATKIFRDSLSYVDAIQSGVRSREKLGVGTIDLLYVHWPMVTYDPAETLPALDDLVARGVARHVGVSNFTPDLVEEAIDGLDAPLAANQVEFHPLCQQPELVEHAAEHGYTLVGYSPLGGGEALENDAVQAVAKKHDASPAAVCIAWVLDHENVVAIPKATGREHLAANLAAADLELDDADRERIAGIDREYRVVDYAAAPWHDGGEDGEAADAEADAA